MDFTNAFKAAKEGKSIRMPDWAPGVVVRVQLPDGETGMTHPYLYIETPEGKTPWNCNPLELFSDQWIVLT